MSKKIVYFIQPSELDGTNKYKIGVSNNFENFYNRYGIGSTWISINEVSDSTIVKKMLRKIFNDKFVRVQGYKYFMGNCNEMLKEYNTIVMPYVLEKLEVDNGSDIVEINKEQTVENTVVKEIPVEDKKKFKCDKCDYSSIRKYNYDRHVGVCCLKKMYIL